MSNYFRWNAGRKRQGTPTLESQPGAHTGATRKYIPGYSDSSIVFLNTSSGNDANTGASIAQALLTYSAAVTAAGTTKKIRLVNSATLTSNITKPTEATIGTTSSISSDTATAFNTWSSSTAAWAVGHNLIRLKWFWQLDKFVLVGGSAASKIGYSSDGLAFTESTTGFGTSVVYDIDYADDIGLLIAVGADGKIETSPDGITWTTRTSGTSSLLSSVVWSKSLSLIIAAGNSNTIITSPDGISWTAVNGMSQEIINDIGSNNIACLFADSTHILAGTNMGNIYRTTDGNNWVKTTITNSDSVSDIAYGAGVYFAGVSSSINPSFTSTDGIVWAANAGTKAIGEQVIYANDLRLFISANAADGVFYSADAVTWTAASPAPSVRYGVAYSPKLGRLVGTGAGTIRYSDLVAVTVSSSIAGFSVGPVLFSGSLVAYNCTFNAPHTTAALSLDSCRVTESGSHISNNAVTATATLVEGDIHYTGVYAAANALDLNLNTIAGTLYIYNGSTTNYERIRDNIIENGVRTSYPVTVTSGNTRGTSSDGTIFGQFHTTSDPMLVDETDYKLQRVLDGYQYDSPMVAASQYYYNQATTQTFRDNGAWSYNEGSATYKYQRTFNFLMPATAIGSAIDFVRHNRANLHVAEDGTPDAVNTPDSRWEEIVMQFKTLPADHIDFINWLEGQVDMTCDISLSPSLTPTTAVTASGATAAGEAVITITDNSGLDSGDQLTIDGNNYTVLYTYGTTKVVLDRITTTALSDTESITVKYDTGFGEYQYVPMLERRLSRWYETDENYMRGLQIRFARKLP